jgi:hypothetical protein
VAQEIHPAQAQAKAILAVMVLGQAFLAVAVVAAHPLLVQLEKILEQAQEVMARRLL